MKELNRKLKEKWSFVDKRCEGVKRRTEWCAEADRYRCMRCGHDLVRRMDRQGEVLIWCRKFSGYARQRIWDQS